MDWCEQLADVNYLAVVVATITTFVLGATWYAWALFGKAWAKHVGLSKKQMDDSSGMVPVFSMTAMGSFIASTTMAALLLATNTEGVLQGAIFGFLIGFAFRFTAHVMHNGFERKNHELTVINSMYDMVQLAVVGAILGGWM